MSFEANICHFSYVFTVVRVFTVIFCLQTVLREKGPFGKGRRRKVILYSHLTLAKRISLGAKPNIALPQYPCRKANTAKSTAKGAPAIKQVAHGRCLGRRHGRLILPCRFSVFVCCVCAFAHFCATCYRYNAFAHADTDFRMSAFLCFFSIRYPFTRMFVLAVSPA